MLGFYFLRLLLKQYIKIRKIPMIDNTALSEQILQIVMRIPKNKKIIPTKRDA